MNKAVNTLGTEDMVWFTCEGCGEEYIEPTDKVYQMDHGVCCECICIDCLRERVGLTRVGGTEFSNDYVATRLGYMVMTASKWREMYGK